MILQHSERALFLASILLDIFLVWSGLVWFCGMKRYPIMLCIYNNNTVFLFNLCITRNVFPKINLLFDGYVIVRLLDETAGAYLSANQHGSGKSMEKRSGLPTTEASN